MSDKRSRRPRGQVKAHQAGACRATAPAPATEPVQPGEALAEPSAIPPQELPAPTVDGQPGVPDDTPASASGQQSAEIAPPGALPTPPRLHDQRSWHCLHEAVVGLSHRNASPPLPCQDAAFSRHHPRPTLVIADGAGSAAVSDLGAQAVVSATARLLHTLDKQVAALLDEPVAAQDLEHHGQQARTFALLLVKHAKGVLDDLAEWHRRPARDFRCTLLLVVAGTTRALWLKIGDGALVFERRHWQADGTLHAELHTLGETGKGEFANLTQFIDHQLDPADVQSGLLDLHDISGLAAMSDGAAEKLIAQDGSRVARQLEHWLEALRQGKLPRRNLTRSFYSDAFCTGSTGDDCSIGLLASDIQWVAESHDQLTIG